MATQQEKRTAVVSNAEHASLPSWSDGAAKQAILEFVRKPRAVPAAGNSNGDIPMLEFTQHQDKRFLRLLVLHDDGEREFDYTSGAEQALEKADASSWTVVSVKNDWATVF